MNSDDLQPYRSPNEVGSDTKRKSALLIVLVTSTVLLIGGGAAAFFVMTPVQEFGGEGRMPVRAYETMSETTPAPGP